MKHTISFEGYQWPRFVLKNNSLGLVRVFDRWNDQDVFLGGVYTLKDGRRHKRDMNARQFIALARWRRAIKDKRP